tara:strand:+ start:321 stop:554 length:234 start_codon:yes stop_codon:yes gene_type:complete
MRKFFVVFLLFSSLSLGASNAIAPNYSDYGLVLGYDAMVRLRDTNIMYSFMFRSDYFAGKAAAYQELINMLEDKTQN